MPSVSIAMATYNGEKYLASQLESLARQSLLPKELAICDDGSTDGTMKIAAEFAKYAPFSVRIITNEKRLGFAQNFIKCTEYCNGEIIAFCDQDDIWHPEKICEISNYFDAHDCLLVNHDFRVFTSKSASTKTDSYFEELNSNSLPLEFSLKGCTTSFRRELIAKVGWPPSEENWGHDVWLCFMTTAFGWREYLHKPLIDYRIHDDNVSGWLFTDRHISKRLLRRITTPHFGPRNDMDKFVAICVEATCIDSLEKHLKGKRQLAPKRVEQILAAIAEKKRVISFQQSPTYQWFIARAWRASGLFLSGAYRASGDLSGFLADVFRKRSLPSKI